MRVKDKVSIVTGAAQGIGKRYAEMLSAEGAKVVLVDIKREAAEENAAAIVAGGGDAMAYGVDLTDQAAVRQMVDAVVDRYGGVDVLVNNAALYAGYERHTMTDVPVDYWERFMKINVTSVLIATQAVVPSMKERGKGKIINQSSSAGTTAGSVYGLTKLGVQGLTVAFARELGPHNINVNCVAPGVTDTQATRDHYPGDTINDLVDQMHTIKRLGTADDQGQAVLFLASDESDSFTGQTLHADFGAILLPI